MTNHNHPCCRDLEAENARMRSDLAYFVERVEAGMIQSKKTYARFKATLEALNQEATR